jgi:hypothetical protein
MEHTNGLASLLINALTMGHVLGQRGISLFEFVDEDSIIEFVGDMERAWLDRTERDRINAPGFSKWANEYCTAWLVARRMED